MSEPEKVSVSNEQIAIAMGEKWKYDSSDRNLIIEALDAKDAKRAEDIDTVAQNYSKQIEAIDAEKAGIQSKLDSLNDKNYGLRLENSELRARLKNIYPPMYQLEQDGTTKIVGCENCAALQKKADRLRGALEKIANRDVPFPDYDWSDWNGGDAASEAEKLIGEFAQAALKELS